MEELRVTQEKLAKLDGKEGRAVCVVVDGKVYDLSESKLWNGGEHMKRHRAGQDLSAEISAAPHGKEVLDRPGIRQVGILSDEGLQKEDLPAFLVELFRRFPILRRHPHPMIVHFPMAYLVGAALLLMVEALLPRARILESVVFVMLVMASVFTPPAILTGLLTWWVNYGARPMRPVTRKLQLAVILALAEMACLVMRARGPIQEDAVAGLYFACVMLLAVCVSGLGWYGGHLTFPYAKTGNRGGEDRS